MSSPVSLLSRPALALPLLLLALLPGRAEAQVMPSLYGMSQTGTVTVNGTQLEKLPSSYSGGNGSSFFQTWHNLVVDGADRYMLRLDGTLYKNGKQLYKLPFGTTVTPQGSFVFSWIGLAYGASGIYALRDDGTLTLNGVITVILPNENLSFAYTKCVAVPDPLDPDMSDVYCLRSDGTVFKNNLAASVFRKFTGGMGLNLATNPSSTALDGLGTETIWIDMAAEPGVPLTLRALRRDGKISSGSSPAVIPPAVDPDLMALPFPIGGVGIVTDEALNENRYRHLSVPGTNEWIAVRGNGQMYTQLSLVTPFVDFPDDGNEQIDDTYVDQAFVGEDYWTIRWDGRVYANTDATPILNLVGSGYRTIALSAEAPDLTTFKNPKPLAETYTATVVEHTPVSLPVNVTDLELAPDDIAVSLLDPLKKPLPAGLVYNDDESLLPRTITWDDPTPKGTYTVPIVVSDGVNKPKTYNYKIKVILADTNPLKNKKPVFTKVKSLQALVGFEYQLPMFAVDADEGDTVSLSVDLTKEPFLTKGAAFDIDTGIFTWTPTFDDIGKVKVKFFATDALLAKSSYTVTINVVSGFVPLPAP